MLRTEASMHGTLPVSCLFGLHPSGARTGRCKNWYVIYQVCLWSKSLTLANTSPPALIPCQPMQPAAAEAAGSSSSRKPGSSSSSRQPGSSSRKPGSSSSSRKLSSSSSSRERGSRSSSSSRKPSRSWKLRSSSSSSKNPRRSRKI